MFDWVLNIPWFLDGYYLDGLSSLYVYIFVNVSKMQFQDHNVVHDLSFKGVFIFQIQNPLLILDPKYFYEMAICCVITSYNNALIYKLNTFIKTKL